MPYRLATAQYQARNNSFAPHPIFMGWKMGFEPTISSATNWRFNQLSYIHHMARQKGLEPLTYCLEGSCSIQLSYWRKLVALERVMGIEPTRPAWKAGVLPLNYTRIISDGLYCSTVTTKKSSIRYDKMTFFIVN